MESRFIGRHDKKACFLFDLEELIPMHRGFFDSIFISLTSLDPLGSKWVSKEAKIFKNFQPLLSTRI